MQKVNLDRRRLRKFGMTMAAAFLAALFYLIFTPAGLAMRLFRIDLLERKKKEGTYWKKKDKIDFNPLNYERRFYPPHVSRWHKCTRRFWGY